MPKNLPYPDVIKRDQKGNETLDPRGVQANFEKLVQLVGDASAADFSGNGSPEGVVTAPIGSTFRQTDGGIGSTFWVKEAGVGNTGWASK